MNPTNPKHPWSRLTAAARTVRDERHVAAPYGFATRVAALALESERAVTSLLDRFAFRAVGVACLLALVSLAVNFGALAGTEETENLSNDDTVAVVLNLTD